MKLTKLALLTSASLMTLSTSSAIAAETLVEALTTGKTSANVRIRYEGVDDSTNKNADAGTIRTRLTYTTGAYKGFSAGVEFEDSRQVFGASNYNDLTGNGAGYAVVADPETTELDQAYIQYQGEQFRSRIGRQVITFDNQRFIGHVGWRQDRQTFDAISNSFAYNDKLTFNLGYIYKRNRILAETADKDSKDSFVNIAYKTDIGKFTGYAYLLEIEHSDNEIDTFGLRYMGDSMIGDAKVNYTLEYAAQSNDPAEGSSKDTSYVSAEVSTKLSGLGFKLGYELLGSDDGDVGFTTPLATGHKFNGWADMFLGTPAEGLQDIYASVGGQLAGGKWAVIYHKFDADDSSENMDDFGSEIDAVYTRGFGKNLVAGIKYAAFDAEDYKDDVNKVWVWTEVKF